MHYHKKGLWEYVQRLKFKIYVKGFYFSSFINMQQSTHNNQLKLNIIIIAYK